MPKRNFLIDISNIMPGIDFEHHNPPYEIYDAETKLGISKSIQFGSDLVKYDLYSEGYDSIPEKGIFTIHDAVVIDFVDVYCKNRCF